MVNPRRGDMGQFYLISSLMTQVMGQSTPSAHLQIIQNWEELLTHQGCAAFHRELDEKWTNRNLMRLDKGKCKVLHLGRNNLIHQYTDTNRLGSSTTEEELWP